MSALLGGEVDDDWCAEAPMMPYISFVQASPGEEDDEGCAEACISCLSIRIIYGGDLHHEVLKHDVDVDVCDGCRRTN